MKPLDMTDIRPCGRRILSWGGARQDVDQPQESPTRITGTQMDGPKQQRLVWIPKI